MCTRRRPLATAMLVADGIWPGSVRTPRRRAGRADRVVELDGAWVAPAFVDAHVHVIDAGSRADGARSVRCTKPRKRCSAGWGEPSARRLRMRSSGAPDGTRPGGHPADRVGRPTPRELDAVCGGRGVYLSRADLHSAAASTGLLTPPGSMASDGPVDRRRITTPFAPPPAGCCPQLQRQQAANAFFAAAARCGIGMVHDCSGPDIGDALEIAWFSGPHRRPA